MHTRIRIVSAAALTLLIVSPTVGEDGLTNRQIIAAMPTATKSVLLYRFDELMSEKSLYKDDTAKMLEAVEEQGAFEQPLWTAAAKAGLRVLAQGGSEFTGPANPDGVGAGDFKARFIVVTEEPVTTLEKQVKEGGFFEGETIEHKSDEQSVIYEGKLLTGWDEEGNPTPEEWFVAYPDLHTIVAAQDLDEARHMQKSLKDPGAAVPKQWQKVASEVNLESPVVVLREFDPSNESNPLSPVNPRLPEEDRLKIEALALTVPEVTSRGFQLYALSPEPEKTQMFLRWFLGSGEWRIEPMEKGFRAEIEASPGDRPGHIYLRLPLAFGQYIAI